MVHGHALQSSDFAHVSDVVRALQLAATAPGVSDHVPNVGTGRSMTALDLVAALNRVPSITIMPTHGPRPYDVHLSLAKVDRGRADLGFAGTAGFGKGLGYAIGRGTVR